MSSDLNSNHGANCMCDIESGDPQSHLQDSVSMSFLSSWDDFTPNLF